MIGYYIIAGLVFLISAYVSNKLKSKFKTYSKIHLKNGRTGEQIAKRMLSDHGITDVKVISVKGQLTDHYNPADKTVNLSEPVFSQQNAAAAAVAAELGALREQAPLTARSHINLSGLNCTLDSAFMSVKTNGMWDSRVVEVTK